jgi:antitoxin (DNA-binding transcriptional repressor) of toxin-antitoxin stability system
MVRAVGIRELRADASEVLRRVREKQEAVEVTCPEQLIARIVPVVPPAETAETLSAVWTDMDRLAGKIGRHWRAEPGGAAVSVRDGRRGGWAWPQPQA